MNRILTTRGICQNSKNNNQPPKSQGRGEIWGQFPAMFQVDLTGHLFVDSTHEGETRLTQPWINPDWNRYT